MKAADLIGTWEVAKAMSFVGGKFAMFTVEEVLAEVNARKAAGTLDEDPESLTAGFSSRTEFTEDGKVFMWMKAPAGIPQEEIDKAIEEGDVKAFKDGFFCLEEKEWKEENGEILYNSKEHREVFGEVQSPWDKLELNEDGLLPFGGGMMLLRKL